MKMKLGLAAGLIAGLVAIPAVIFASYDVGVTAFGIGDYDRAADEFREDAAAGDAQSMYMLGRLYALGMGVEENFAKAYYWHSLAAAQGHEEAAAAAANLAEIMTPPQLAEARQAVGAELGDVGALPGSQLAQLPGPPERDVPAIETGILELPDEQVADRPVQVQPRRRLEPGETVEEVIEGSAAPSVGIRPDEPDDSAIDIIDVTRIEQRLRELGYPVGASDGVVDAQLRAAIASFQERQGIPPTGRITQDLMQALNVDPVTPPERLTAIIPRDGDGASFPNRDDIAGVQRRLKELGFNPGPVDGIVGPRTRSAVRQWAQSHGYRYDRRWGNLTPDVVAAILAGIPPGAYAARTLPPPAAEPGTPMPPQPGMPQPGATTGGMVVAIQRELGNHGYLGVPPTGTLNDRTQAAIRDYQRDAGLPVTGEPSPWLLDHLLYSWPQVVQQPAEE